jgi:hypothetical protein
MSKLAQKIAKEKARLEKKASERVSFEKIDWYKPNNGENLIRLLPNVADEDEFPFKQVKIHYIAKELDDGRSVDIPVRCLTDFEKDCPVCNAHQKAMKAKNKELSSKLRPQERYLYNVLDYNSKKVQPWAAGVTVHQLIMEHAGDLDNPFDPAGGRDWKLVKKTDSRKPRPLNVSYSIRPTPKDSSIPSKFATMIEEGAIDLETLYATEELAAMKAFLENLDLDGGDDDEDEDERPAKKKSKSKARDDEDEEEEEDDEEEEADDDDSDDEDEEDDDEEDEEEEDAAALKKAKAKAAAAKAKAKSKVEDDEDEEEEDDEDDEDEEEDPPPKKKNKAGKVIDERDSEPEDEDEEEDEDEDDEEEDPPPKKKKSSKPEVKGKKKSKLDVDVEDEDLEKELRDLGVE